MHYTEGYLYRKDKAYSKPKHYHQFHYQFYMKCLIFRLNEFVSYTLEGTSPQIIWSTYIITHKSFDYSYQSQIIKDFLIK